MRRSPPRRACPWLGLHSRGRLCWLAKAASARSRWARSRSLAGTQADWTCSLAQMFLGNAEKVYIIDKTENNPATIAGHRQSTLPVVLSLWCRADYRTPPQPPGPPSMTSRPTRTAQWTLSPTRFARVGRSWAMGRGSTSAGTSPSSQAAWRPGARLIQRRRTIRRTEGRLSGACCKGERW